MTRSQSLRASDLIGYHVRNAAGEDLGRIQDFILDPTTGSVRYAVISFVETPGPEIKVYPIPWALLRSSADGGYLVFEGRRNLIERGPAFERREWSEMANPDWEDRLRDYYGVSGPVRPIHERVVMQRVIHERRPASVLAAALGIVLLVGLLGFFYLVSTRGWDQARNTVVNYAENVAYAAKETSEDAALTAKVKTALSLSRRVPSGNINVDTEGLVVSLRGEMPSEETRSLAEMIARDTPGVEELHNNLTVNPTAVATAELDRMRGRVADLETKYLVHDAITKNPGLSGQTIQVDVLDSTVVLSGNVQTSDQKYLAEQTAAGVEGVRSVNDQLRIVPPVSTGELR